MSESTIANRKYPGQVPTLFQPTGSVVGYHENGSIYQQWGVVAVGSNQITIQSAAFKTYANPAYEGQGAPVVGGPNAYHWQQLSVPGGWYQIATTDGAYVWRLTSGNDGAPIVLQATPYTGEDAQWGYNPAT